jgi:hypothetical protein
MRSLLSISFVAILVAGCVSVRPAHLTKLTSPVTRHPSPVTCYNPPSASQLFKATLDIKDHHLTGMMVIKRMEAIPRVPAPGRPADEDSVYRVVFVSEVGMTYFDLELSTTEMKVISCFPSLNKKALFRIIETDLRVLLVKSPVETRAAYVQDSTRNLVFSGGTGKYKSWQIFSPAGDTLLSTRAKSTMADPVILTFSGYSDGFPIKILLENPFIGMKLALRKLSEQ